jgi:hypothetical protein
MASIPEIITSINPYLYLATSDNPLKAKKQKVKFGEFVKEFGTDEGIKKYKEWAGERGMSFGTKEEESHMLVYDSSSEMIEPIYFFILDLFNDLGFKIEKLVDNFSPSPGSSTFGEMGQRKTLMQQQGSQMMEKINAVLRSVLNLIYDLKEWRIRLQSYTDLKNPQKKEAALLSLKQIWMDKVDINKGNSSVKAMGLGQAGFATLIDAFLIAKNEEDVKKIDLNDRVKRILLSRINEFNTWLEQSEKELRKRYELEKNYLKSQVSSLKLYSRWAKPYLKAAHELEGVETGRDAGLVKSFNTVKLQLTLLGKREFRTDDIEQAALHHRLPMEFKKLAASFKRKYFTCVLIDFNFRAIPRQGAYIGRTEVKFSAYALNEEEIKKINEELEKSDIGDVLKLIEGSTGESMKQLQEEIDFFLEEETKEEKSEKSSDQSNPFVALMGGYNEKSKKEKSSKKKDDSIRKDDYLEKNHIRPFVAEDAKTMAFTIFDVYKKAHGMPSYT